jgi:hypothetical protein
MSVAGRPLVPGLWRGLADLSCFLEPETAVHSVVSVWHRLGCERQ